MKEILDGYVVSADSALGPDGLIYDCPTQNNVVVVRRRNADGTYTVVHTFDDTRESGKDGGATIQFLPGTGDLLVELSTRDGAGKQVLIEVILHGVCPAPDVLLPIYRGTYKSNAEIMDDGLLFVRLNKANAAIAQLQDAVALLSALRKA